MDLGKKDGFGLDGTGYHFDGENPTDRSFSIEDAKQMKLRAIQQGLKFFGLWQAARQGLATTTTATEPSDRTYEVPTETQKQIEIELLRFGLSPIADKSSG